MKMFSHSQRKGQLIIIGVVIFLILLVIGIIFISRYLWSMLLIGLAILFAYIIFLMIKAFSHSRGAG